MALLVYDLDVAWLGGLRDLMDRMGHDSARAVLIHQDATREAGRAIADAIHTQIEGERDDDEGCWTGSSRRRVAR